MHSPQWLRIYLAHLGLLLPALDAMWCTYQLPEPITVIRQLRQRIEAAGHSGEQTICGSIPGVSLATDWQCDTVPCKLMLSPICAIIELSIDKVWLYWPSNDEPLMSGTLGSVVARSPVVWTVSLFT